MTQKDERHYKDYLADFSKCIGRAGFRGDFGVAINIGPEHALFVESPNTSITLETIFRVQETLKTYGIQSRTCHNGHILTSSASWALVIWKD